MNMNLFRYVFCHFMKRMALLAILTTTCALAAEAQVAFLHP